MLLRAVLCEKEEEEEEGVGKVFFLGEHTERMSSSSSVC